MPAWRVVLDKRATRELERLGYGERERIREFIDERLLRSNDPRLLGAALTGALKGLWRYRVGDYRIVARIDDGVLTILVIAIQHRSQVYR